MNATPAVIPRCIEYAAKTVRLFLSRLVSKAFPNAEILQAENGQAAVDIIADRLASSAGACVAVDSAVSPVGCLPWACGAGQRHAAESGAVPCAITLDREMPVLDGPAAARLLRGRLGFAGLIAGVTSCSQATSGDLIEAGADCVLQKGSISIDTLRRVLGPAVAAATTPAAPAATHQAAPAAGVHGGAKGVRPPAVEAAASVLAGPLVVAAAEQRVAMAASAMPSPSAARGLHTQRESVKVLCALAGSGLTAAETATAGAGCLGPSTCPACLAPPFPIHPARAARHPSAPAAAVGAKGCAAAGDAISAEGAILVASALAHTSK
jgi:CheY-like chemotaxis protein